MRRFIDTVPITKADCNVQFTVISVLILIFSRVWAVAATTVFRSTTCLPQTCTSWTTYYTI